MDLWGLEPITITTGAAIGLTILTLGAYISITQSESYKEAVKEAANQISSAVNYAKNTLKQNTQQVINTVIVTIENAYSKGKKQRDGEGNPIPVGNQKQSPLGKGANAGPENIGDPGDLGDGNFPDRDPKIMLATAAILAGVTQIGTDNKEFKEKLESIPKLSNNNTTTQEIILKQGSTDAKNK